MSLHRSLRAATGSEKNLREHLEVTEALLERTMREVEKLNSALTLSSAETEQLRVYYEQIRRKDMSEMETLLHELGPCYMTLCDPLITCFMCRRCKGSKLGLKRGKEGN